VWEARAPRRVKRFAVHAPSSAHVHGFDGRPRAGDDETIPFVDAIIGGRHAGLATAARDRALADHTAAQRDRGNAVPRTRTARQREQPPDRASNGLRAWFDFRGEGEEEAG